MVPMSDDTRIGGSQRQFPPTRHSVVLDLGHADGPVRERAFDALVQGYWKPVYTYLRLKHRLDNEKAKDLTQGFFAHVLEKGTLDAFDPARARFRTWLRRCLDAWAANQHEAEHRGKRGGAFQHVSLDFMAAAGEIRERELPAADDDRDRFFEREWTRHLFQLALAEVEADCAARGRPEDFALFRRYDLEAPDRGEDLRYADLAAEFGVPVTRVTNSLHAVRRRVREALLRRLRELCATEAEFEAEARDLLGGEA